jgi:hypothetical protein
MAWFLVNALPKGDRLRELESVLREESLHSIQPEGHELQRSLSHARLDGQGGIWWEQQCYCSPPLTSDRLTVLDRYFTLLDIQEVPQGEGWHRIDEMPFLFPALFQE